MYSAIALITRASLSGGDVSVWDSQQLLAIFLGLPRPKPAAIKSATCEQPWNRSDQMVTSVPMVIKKLNEALAQHRDKGYTLPSLAGKIVESRSRDGSCRMWVTNHMCQFIETSDHALYSQA